MCWWRPISSLWKYGRVSGCAPRLITYYVLFFIHLGTRTVHMGGITPNPDQQWIGQIVRNITDVYEGVLLQNNCKYLIHDRDSKFCRHFDRLLCTVQITPVKLPPRSPNLNAYAERFILSAARPGLGAPGWAPRAGRPRRNVNVWTE